MKRLLWLPFLLLLALALRHDLGRWSLEQGESLRRAGDLAGAEGQLRQAARLGADVTPLAYNLGVSQYRKGDYAAARAHFAAAAAVTGEVAPSALVAASRYNRGNSSVRLAETDRAAARHHLETALADYDRALALEPGDAASRANRAFAQGRLAALLAARAQDEDQRDAETPGRQPIGAPRPGERPGQQGRDRDDSLAPGKNRRDLSPQEAQRLLNEARHREIPAGPLHGGGRNPPGARPEKDW